MRRPYPIDLGIGLSQARCINMIPRQNTFFDKLTIQFLKAINQMPDGANVTDQKNDT